jgi:hypothetical protein
MEPELAVAMNESSFGFSVWIGQERDENETGASGIPRTTCAGITEQVSSD